MEISTTMSSNLLNSTENQTNSTEYDECYEAEETLDAVFMIFFFLSIPVIFGLAFAIRRKNRCLKCCWGRPGFLQPVNFIDSVERRWAFAACFVILTNNVLYLIVGESYWDFFPEDEEWNKKFGWVKVLNKFWEVLTVVVVYYPLMTCIEHRRLIVANVIGFINVVLWIWVYSNMFYKCPYSEEKGKARIYFYVYRIPVYTSFYVVGFSFVLDFVQNVIRKRKRKSTLKTTELEFNTAHHTEYVTNLLRRRKSDDVKGNVIKETLKKIGKRVKYDKICGFRYSTRLICSVTVSITILIWLVTSGIELVDFGLQWLENYCDVALGDSAVTELCNFLYIGLIKVVAFLSLAFSTLVILIFILNTLISYKRRWHQLLKGDYSWQMYGTKIVSPPNTLLSGLRFGGYQVAFVMWGWIVLTVLLFLVLVFLVFAFILPLSKGESNFFIQSLIDIWPTLLLGIVIIPLIQKLICRFIFLQRKGSEMALDNRRIYNAASYYFFLLNVIVGIFSCLKRIIIPLVLGTLFLSRLDQPLFMKGYESRDPGFNSFVSMLFVDLYHNHPVVRVFVELLQQVRHERHSGELGPVQNGTEIIDLEKRNNRSKLIRNRWQKLMTLVNNPSLALKALEDRMKEERIRAKQMTRKETEFCDISIKTVTTEVELEHDESETPSHIAVAL